MHKGQRVSCWLFSSKKDNPNPLCTILHQEHYCVACHKILHVLSTANESGFPRQGVIRAVGVTTSNAWGREQHILQVLENI